MIFQAIMACVRIVVVVVIFGGIGYVIYDNVRSDQEKHAPAPGPPIPKIGDMAIMNSNTVGCQTPEDALKVKDLLSKFSDRQPAASYSVEHGCTVLAKAKSYKVEAFSAKNSLDCLQVPGQQHCVWVPVDALTKQNAPAPRS